MHEKQQASGVAVTLRAIAAWLESHPEFTLGGVYYEDRVLVVRDFTPKGETLAELARSLGGRWQKDANERDTGDDALFKLTQEIAPGARAELIAWRSEVCERVVTGTKTELVPDPDAPLVEREVETVEWRCVPLLEAAS